MEKKAKIITACAVLALAAAGAGTAIHFMNNSTVEEVTETPKAITLKAEGYPEAVLTITVAAPAAEIGG